MSVEKTQNQGVAPVTYGTGARPPRGDYGRARSDYTCEQNHAQYTAADHQTYRRLTTRQLQQLPGLACDEFIHAVQQIGKPTQIPHFDAISERLQRATGWQVVGVPGLIPEEAFFALLAERRFPVTDWIRKPEEFDYVVEPDIFHDLFGHVPLLFNPTFADYMQAYGAGGLKASRLDACELLARLYWYTVEFGLINTPKGLRAYGAGILSSAGELQHSVRSAKPRSVRIKVEGRLAGLFTEWWAARRPATRWSRRSTTATAQPPSTTLVSTAAGENGSEVIAMTTLTVYGKPGKKAHAFCCTTPAASIGSGNG